MAMPVDRQVTVAIVERELAAARRLGAHYGWKFSSVVAEKPSFYVTIQSAIDKEVYHVDFELDDYKEMPPYIEFINPATGERGSKRCYPMDTHPEGGAIFHAMPCICHPCSRKAYARYRGPHADWDAQISNWQALAKGLTGIPEILLMIQARINDPGGYKGRMEK